MEFEMTVHRPAFVGRKVQTKDSISLTVLPELVLVPANDSVATAPPPDFEVPDGGSMAWTTVAGSWLMFFSTFGYLYSFGVYQDYYTRVYLTNHTASSIAWIGSLQLMLSFALGIVSGKLFDNGYFHHVEIFGGLIYTFSIFMLSLAKPFQYYQVFLTQGVGMGIGVGCTFVPSASILVHHFRKHKGLATGVALSGSSAGGIVFPIMLNHLFRTVGFGPAVRATGYLVLGCVTVGNAIMRTRLPPLSQRSQLPPPDIKSFFSDPPYMFAVFGLLLSTSGVWFPVFYLQLYAVTRERDATMAFYSLAILNGSSIFGRVTGTWLADLYGPYNIFVPCTFITGASIWAVLGIHDRASLIVVSLFYGIFSGAWLALVVASLGSLARRPEETGARTGLAVALSSFGSLGSAPAQGALLTTARIWIRPIAYSGSLQFASAVVFLIVRMQLAKRRDTWKV